MPPVVLPQTPPTASDLAPHLALSIKTRYVVRRADDFVATAPDLPGQVLELVDHLFVRYSVPRFLYRPMLSESGLRAVFPGDRPVRLPKTRLQQEAELRRWFYAVAWGEPFADLVKDVLSRREAHLFLQAPAHNSIETNLRWARLAALGAPPGACDHILARFWNLDRVPPSRRMEVARFYARAWPDMRPHERDDLADFLRTRLDDPAFSLAGRTLASVRRMSEAWHRRHEHAAYVHSVGWPSDARWRPAFEDWEEREETGTVRAVELTGGRELAEEGAHQGHCVGSYADACAAGRSRIVSLRWSEGGEEIARLTVEVDTARRVVVQIRGRRNRRAAPEELQTVVRWAAAQGLGVGANA